MIWLLLIGACIVTFLIGMRVGGLMAGTHAIICCKCSAHIRDVMARIHGVRFLCAGNEKHGVDCCPGITWKEVNKLLPPQ